jgi:predicted nucleic acid-binding protein
MDSGFNTEYDNSAFGLASRYFDTTDNPSIRLSHKDLIVVYKPITDDKIELTEENVHQYIKILPSVRLYEYYNLSITVSSDYFWLSGGNNIINNHSIGGNNYFKDINYFENISVQNISAIDAKINDISVVNGLSGDWSKIVDSNTKFSLFNLCTAVSSKIFIDNRVDKDAISGTSDLSIVKLSKEEFDEKVTTDNQLSDNILYIVDSDYIDAYGQVISNLTMSDLSGKEASEAVNKSYFENVVSDISNYLSDEISNEIDRAVAYEKYLSDEISLSANNLCIALSNENIRAVAYEKYLSNEIKLNDADIKYLSDEISINWEATCLSANNLCIAL